LFIARLPVLQRKILLDGVSLKNAARFNASRLGSQAENPWFSDNEVPGYEHFFLFISYWNDKKNCP
jgi:hypothetical protein